MALCTGWERGAGSMTEWGRGRRRKDSSAPGRGLEPWKGGGGWRCQFTKLALMERRQENDETHFFTFLLSLDLPPFLSTSTALCLPLPTCIFSQGLGSNRQPLTLATRWTDPGTLLPPPLHSLPGPTRLPGPEPPPPDYLSSGRAGTAPGTGPDT